MDPRPAIIQKRLEGIKQIIAVSGGKGGIGKSMTSSVLSLVLAKSGYKVGLLDLDLCGPSTQLILGATDIFPTEENGIVPKEINGVKFMSITCFTQKTATPLRGVDITNAITELLAITLWGELDFLVIDMPPGLGDTLLDTIKLINSNFLILTTPSKTSTEIAKTHLEVLTQSNAQIFGVLENMSQNNSPNISQKLAEEFDVSFIGQIEFDKELENAIGNTEKLLETTFSKELYSRIVKILEQ